MNRNNNKRASEQISNNKEKESIKRKIFIKTSTKDNENVQKTVIGVFKAIV